MENPTYLAENIVVVCVLMEYLRDYICQKEISLLIGLCKKFVVKLVAFQNLHVYWTVHHYEQLFWLLKHC